MAYFFIVFKSNNSLPKEIFKKVNKFIIEFYILNTMVYLISQFGEPIFMKITGKYLYKNFIKYLIRFANSTQYQPYQPSNKLL